MTKYPAEIIAHHCREAGGYRTDYHRRGDRSIIPGLLLYALFAAAFLAAFLDAI